MMCQRIGCGPISTIGFGRYSVSSRSRVPWPPQRMTTGMSLRSIDFLESLESMQEGSFEPRSVILEDIAERPELLDLQLVHRAVARSTWEPRADPEGAVARNRADGMSLDEGRIEGL